MPIDLEDQSEIETKNENDPESIRIAEEFSKSISLMGVARDDEGMPELMQKEIGLWMETLRNNFSDLELVEKVEAICNRLLTRFLPAGNIVSYKRLKSLWEFILDEAKSNLLTQDRLKQALSEFDALMEPFEKWRTERFGSDSTQVGDWLNNSPLELKSGIVGATFKNRWLEERINEVKGKCPDAAGLVDAMLQDISQMAFNNGQILHHRAVKERVSRISLELESWKPGSPNLAILAAELRAEHSWLKDNFDHWYRGKENLPEAEIDYSDAFDGEPDRATAQKVLFFLRENLMNMRVMVQGCLNKIEAGTVTDAVRANLANVAEWLIGAERMMEEAFPKVMFNLKELFASLPDLEIEVDGFDITRDYPGNLYVFGNDLKDILLKLSEAFNPLAVEYGLHEDELRDREKMRTGKIELDLAQATVEEAGYNLEENPQDMDFGYAAVEMAGHLLDSSLESFSQSCEALRDFQNSNCNWQEQLATIKTMAETDPDAARKELKSLLQVVKDGLKIVDNYLRPLFQVQELDGPYYEENVGEGMECWGVAGFKGSVTVERAVSFANFQTMIKVATRNRILKDLQLFGNEE